MTGMARQAGPQGGGGSRKRHGAPRHIRIVTAGTREVKSLASELVVGYRFATRREPWKLMSG